MQIRSQGATWRVQLRRWGVGLFFPDLLHDVHPDERPQRASGTQPGKAPTRGTKRINRWRASLHSLLRGPTDWQARRGRMLKPKNVDLRWRLEYGRRRRCGPRIILSERGRSDTLHQRSLQQSRGPRCLPSRGGPCRGERGPRRRTRGFQDRSATHGTRDIGMVVSGYQ